MHAPDKQPARFVTDTWRPSRTILLLLSDCLVVLGIFWILVMLRNVFTPLSLELYLRLSPILLLDPFLGQALGTCQSIALPPPRELKALSLAITLAFTGLMIFMFATQSGAEVSRLVVLSAWLFSLLAVPVARSQLRRRCCRSSWWASPLVLLGKENTDELRANFEKYPERGLRFVAQLDGAFANGGLNEQLVAAARRHPGAFILLLPDALTHHNSIGAQNLNALLSELNSHFRAVLFLPGFMAHNPLIWLTPRDLGSSAALFVRQNLHDWRKLLLKRMLDLSLIAITSFLVLPLWIAIALAIMFDSRGAPVYFQERVGRNGTRFRLCKFRTMAPNSDALLQKALDENSELRREWERDRKLKKDPRVTRVGATLRKTSLDELPQLWNVLKGDMSLVGPRPIVESEIPKYGPAFKEYCRVSPGLTGLWQISGRNDTPYEERVRLDQHYVSNWSVWFDIWVLAKTVPVILSGHGAY
ncbi:MAG: undecaprenyl-phosphate galactose phosphotransferase WbaP [Deltaproteobacteria bacterium]|jgi:Undecaprenyl-phosphate galactose phosphotransferase WbaP|nr:undecaprenyl-phosphate galactose phosphotransferase WbaP [Deltaproteobacteria bacterium]